MFWEVADLLRTAFIKLIIVVNFEFVKDLFRDHSFNPVEGLKHAVAVVLGDFGLQEAEHRHQGLSGVFYVVDNHVSE